MNSARNDGPEYPTAYSDFLAAKTQLTDADGFEPTALPDHLYGFQRDLVAWAVQQGRGAVPGGGRCVCPPAVLRGRHPGLLPDAGDRLVQPEAAGTDAPAARTRSALTNRRFVGLLLGIDRDAEHLNSIAAAEAGVGAPVVDYRPDLGAMVVRFLEGSTWDNQSFDRAGSPTRAGRAIRQLHEGPRFVGDFDMFARRRRYLRLIQDNGYWLPDGYPDHEDRLEQVRRALGTTATVPCNNDLLAANFIDDGEKLWLIDYEYSGNNDACFEIGNLWAEAELDHMRLDRLRRTRTDHAAEQRSEDQRRGDPVG